jgi:hypothetical protein
MVKPSLSITTSSIRRSLRLMMYLFFAGMIGSKLEGKSKKVKGKSGRAEKINQHQHSKRAFRLLPFLLLPCS